MPALKDFKDDFALLTEAGFVAVAQMDEDGANKLFHAAQILDEESSLPKIGLAAVSLHRLESQKCVEILEPLVKAEPDNHRAAVLLGIGYLLSGQKAEEGEKLLKNAMENADDAPTKRLGELWLEVLDKGMRKSEGPAEPKKKND